MAKQSKRKPDSPIYIWEVQINGMKHEDLSYLTSRVKEDMVGRALVYFFGKESEVNYSYADERDTFSNDKGTLKIVVTVNKEIFFVWNDAQDKNLTKSYYYTYYPSESFHAFKWFFTFPCGVMATVTLHRDIATIINVKLSDGKKVNVKIKLINDLDDETAKILCKTVIDCSGHDKTFEWFKRLYKALSKRVDACDYFWAECEKGNSGYVKYVDGKLKRAVAIYGNYVIGYDSEHKGSYRITDKDGNSITFDADTKYKHCRFSYSGTDYGAAAKINRMKKVFPKFLEEYRTF